MRSVLFALSASLALCAATTTTATAQGCTSGADTFRKRDSLPDVPAGLTAVSVIPGLCEGESCGMVFELPAGTPPQLVTQVVCPWGSAGGVNGNVGAVDVEIYDGVSYPISSGNMGTLVWSMSNDIAANMQVTSHALNTLDTSTYDILVGTVPPSDNPSVRRFAVCFRSLVNPNGSCAGGFTTNFFTDNGAFTGCSAIPGANLIEILGQGWRDASTATVQGFPLCPIFYNGNWAIRCCTQDAFGATYSFFGAGCAGAAGQSQLIPASLPQLGQTMVVNVTNVPFQLGLMMTGTSDTVYNGLPLPLDLGLAGFPAGCTLYTSLDATDLLFAPTPITPAAWAFNVPNQPVLAGATFFQQALLFDDPTLDLFQSKLSDAATWVIGY